MEPIMWASIKRHTIRASIGARTINAVGDKQALPLTKFYCKFDGIVVSLPWDQLHEIHVPEEVYNNMCIILDGKDLMRMLEHHDN